MRLLLILGFALAVMPAAMLWAGGKQHAKAASYAVQVVPFQIQEGIDFPEEYVAAISTDLVSELSRSKTFQQVLGPGDKAAGSAPLLQLTGTVIKFRKGNRTARALIGGLAGALAGRTQINAHIRFVDAATQQVKMERDVVGMMAGGGKSIKATEQLAKQVAKAAKKEL